MIITSFPVLLQGWPAIAQLVQPVMALYAKDMAEVVTRIYSYSKDSLSLLHLAVRSGNPKMVSDEAPLVTRWNMHAGKSGACRDWVGFASCMLKYIEKLRHMFGCSTLLIVDGTF